MLSADDAPWPCFSYSVSGSMWIFFFDFFFCITLDKKIQEGQSPEVYQNGRDALTLHHPRLHGHTFMWHRSPSACCTSLTVHDISPARSRFPKTMHWCQRPDRTVSGMAGVMVFPFSWWLPLCLIWKLNPSCAPGAKAGTGLHGAALLLASGGWRCRPRRPNRANIKFPCFSKIWKEIETKLQ